MATTPANKKNAIDSAMFVLKFSREFSYDENQAVSGVAEVLKDDLPKSDEVKKFSINLDVAKPQQSGEFETAGLALKKFSPDGVILWELNVIKDSIVAVCKSYRGWTEEKETAVRFLKAVLHVLERSDNQINSIILQITDRFIELEPNEYDIGRVFNKNSCYLTKNVLSQGPLWHVFQGWFENDNGGREALCLNVLNISTKSTAVHESSIEHAIHYQTNKPQLVASYAGEENCLDSIFDDLHERNKVVIKELLCAEQLKAIGL